MPDTKPMNLNDTMTRVRSELKDEGKSKVDTEKEASGSFILAEHILKSAASAEGLFILMKVNKKSVSAKVTEND